MRFIWNFFFFGFIFYLIWLFFPDAFQTLISWANYLYGFLHDLVLKAIERFSGHSSTGPTETHQVTYLLTAFFASF
jgi:hypothetical protein